MALPARSLVLPNGQPGAVKIDFFCTGESSLEQAVRTDASGKPIVTGEFFQQQISNGDGSVNANILCPEGQALVLITSTEVSQGTALKDIVSYSAAFAVADHRFATFNAKNVSALPVVLPEPTPEAVTSASVYYIFSTSIDFAAASAGQTGLSGADSACAMVGRFGRQTIALNTRHFLAFMGDSSTPLLVRLLTNGISPNGVFKNTRNSYQGGPQTIEGITSTFFGTPTLYDENGFDIAGAATAWSGSKADLSSSPDDCDHWRSAKSTDRGGVGKPHGGDSWIFFGSLDCSTPRRFFCITW